MLKRCIPSVLIDIVVVTQEAYTIMADNGSTVDLGPLSNTGAVEAVTGATMKLIGE